MIGNNDVNSLIGAMAYDRDGDKIGKVNQIYIDDVSGQPAWASVHTGLFGANETFVPLESANWDGDGLRVGYEKDFVKDAPNIDADTAITEAQQDELYRYYGLGASGAGRPADGSYVGTDAGAVHDTSGRDTDTAMTRSEEQLHVGKERVETGRARLRKYVVTENQTVTVPVTHEEVRLEREPITDANVGDATSGPDLSDEEAEVVLSEERVVVDKETVPVERVRLEKELVTEDQRVDEDVRKEKIEFDEDDRR